MAADKKVVEELLHKNASLAELDLKGADLSSLDFHKANLEGVVLANADLVKADLSDANLRGADLSGARLEGANLLRASLSGARLWFADLSFCNLSEADLTNADLHDCKLGGARVWRTKLARSRFLSRKNFSLKKGILRKERIDERSSRAAEDGYRALKNHFLLHGKYDDASWASYREKVMEMRQLLEKRSPALIPSFFMNVLCGYGEVPHRVVIVAAGLIFLFAELFAKLHTVIDSTSKAAITSFSDCLYFSVVTFTTLGYGDILPAPFPLARLLAGCEAFLGIFTMGLFVFTLGRRYSAR